MNETPEMVEIESMEDLEQLLASRPDLRATGGAVGVVEEDGTITKYPMSLDDLMFNMHVDEVVNRMRLTPMARAVYEADKETWTVQILGFPPVDVEHPTVDDYMAVSVRRVIWPEPDSEPVTDLAIATAIRDAITGCYKHETDEYVTLDGRRLHNPHPNLDDYDDNTWEGGEA